MCGGVGAHTPCVCSGRCERVCVCAYVWGPWGVGVCVRGGVHVGCVHAVLCACVCVCVVCRHAVCVCVCGEGSAVPCMLRCIKARPASRTANVTYIKKYSILNIVIAHFVLS